MYNCTIWKDRVVDSTTGEVIQEGTNQSAGNFNNMEKGILDESIATAFLMIAVEHLNAVTAMEEKTVTLTNSSSYPFNNSESTIDLNFKRTTTNYDVEAEVIEHSGYVGNILISDKLLNGFKVRFDGSASTVTVKLIIKGGM